MGQSPLCEGEMGRRKTWSIITWVLALAVLGIGVAVALPGSGTPETNASDGQTEGNDALASQELRVIETAARLQGDGPPLAGSVLLSAGWGSGPDQFAVGEGGPIWGPADFALSPDCSAIAILDSWNSRVQIYNMSGEAIGSIPSPGPVGIYLEYLADERVAVFHPGDEYQVLAISPEGGVSKTVVADIGTVCGEPAVPSGMASVGNSLWVRGSNDFWWPVILDSVSLDQQAQIDQSVTGAGRPVTSGFVKATKVSDTECAIAVNDTSSRVTTQLSIEASDRSVSVVHILGSDAEGNTVVQIEVGSYEEPAVAPYRVVRISKDGEQTGELALTDNRDGEWFSSGVKLGSDGRIYQMLRGQEGIQIEAYSF